MAFLEATKTISTMMMQKLDDFVSEIDNVHMVWLKEIEQEANRMFSGDSNTEPELMPKTPSQKRRPRKKRFSVVLQEEARTRRRFSKGRRSNLAASSVKMDLVFEEETEPQPSTSSVGVDSMEVTEPQTSTSSVDVVSLEVTEPQPSLFSPVSLEMALEDQTPQGCEVKAEPVERDTDMNEHRPCLVSRLSTTLSKALVKISASDRRSAEAARPPQLVVVVEPQPSPGRTATKVTLAGTPTRPRVSLTLRHSAAGLRHSLTRESVHRASVRRASRRSRLKKIKAHAANSTCSEDTSAETEDEDEDYEHQPENHSEGFAETEQPEVSARGSSNRVTRASSRRSAAGSSSSPDAAVVQSPVRASRTLKRKAEEHAENSQKKTLTRPKMKSFLQTVHRNQVLMMTPNSLGRTAVMKSFIKHTTPLKVDTVAKEHQKLEALKKKQELEEERIRKMEEEKKKKQEELKRKREERLRKAVEARAKEEQKEEEKKRKIEQKRAQMEEKNDKLRVERLAEEKLKKQLMLKHQEEIDSRRKLEEETRLKRIQQAEEEEKRQQAKRRAEEEAHRAHKLAEARRAQEVKKEQERAERERAEALQREVEKAAREKERKEAEKKSLEDQRKKEEQQRLADEERAAQRLAEEERAAKQRLAEAAAKVQQPLGQSAGLMWSQQILAESSIMKTPTGKDRPAGLNITMDVEQSPQTYSITPKGAHKAVKLTGNPDDYGMDQNSDDSTDDESAPRKPIPSWAEGPKLQQALLREYFNPPDLHALFGTISPPNLEEIFYTKKPRFNKRTSSAVWHSPPMGK